MDNYMALRLHVYLYVQNRLAFRKTDHHRWRTCTLFLRCALLSCDVWAKTIFKCFWTHITHDNDSIMFTLCMLIWIIFLRNFLRHSVHCGCLFMCTICTCLNIFPLIEMYRSIRYNRTSSVQRQHFQKVICLLLDQVYLWHCFFFHPVKKNTR